MRVFDLYIDASDQERVETVLEILMVIMPSTERTEFDEFDRHEFEDEHEVFDVKDNLVRCTITIHSVRVEIDETAVVNNEAEDIYVGFKQAMRMMLDAKHIRHEILLLQ